MEKNIMRTVTQALLALGLVGAMAIGTPITTKAQGIYFGPGGDGYDRRYYRDNDRSYAYDRRYAPSRQNLGNGIYRGANGQPYCYRRGFTVQDGVCKPYRGY